MFEVLQKLQLHTMISATDLHGVVSLCVAVVVPLLNGVVSLGAAAVETLFLLVASGNILLHVLLVL